MKIKLGLCSLFLVVSVFLNTAAFAQTDQLDLRATTIVNAPDVRAWPITATLTQLSFDGSTTRVEFTKHHGPNRWPDITPAGWEGPLQYTLWLFVKVGGQWTGSGFIQFWEGRDGSGSSSDPDVPSLYAKNWYYSSRWTPIFGHGLIQPGESIGMMVTSGNARDNVGPMSVQERSNVVVIQATDRGVFNFDAVAVPLPPVVTQPPVVVTLPPVIMPTSQPPLPAVDYSVLLQRIIELQGEQLGLARDTNTHVANIDRTFAQTVGAASKWLAKYALPAVTAFIAARRLP